MNNHDSIKLFINIQLIIISCCFSFIEIFNIIYFIKSKKLFFELFWLPFLIYFMLCFMKDINDESDFFIEKHHMINKYKIIKIKKL